MRRPKIRRQGLADFERVFVSESPPQTGRQHDEHHHGDRHVAHAVSQFLDVRTAVLRALDDGDDLRERGGFAQGGDAHHQPAVLVHRARVKFRARRFVDGQRFTGEHGLIDGGTAFDDFPIGRHAVARFQDDLVAGAQSRHGHFHFVSVGIEFSRGWRREVHQRAQRAGRPRADDRLEVVAGADERDDRGRFHEVEMFVPAVEQTPDAVAERCAGTEGHERVHVRAAALELAPRPAEKPRAANGHHRRREGEADPFERLAHAPAQDPFAEDERQCERGTKNHGEFPGCHRRTA